MFFLASGNSRRRDKVYLTAENNQFWKFFNISEIEKWIQKLLID